MRKCSVERCEAKSHAHGMCANHYARWKRTGQTGLTNGSGCRDVHERMAFNAKRADSGCLEWAGKLQKTGYARTKYNGVPQMVHRVAWQIGNGPIPDGMFICHHCDNRKCFELSHLFLGTLSDNSIDMAVKRRHPRIKLTHADVSAIRESCASYTEIAKQFGISRKHVEGIRNGRYWKTTDLREALV